MVNINKLAVLALVFISSVSSMGYFRISEQIGNQDPLVMAGTFNESGFKLGSASSLFSKMFENDSSPADFVKQATNSIFSSLTSNSFSLSDHPQPDEKTKRASIKLNLRITNRQIRNAEDVKAFLNHSNAVNYASIDNPCDGVSAPCPYYELRKKQLGRGLENINDEIAFIEEILKKKDCKYLRLRLAVLQRDADSVQAIIKYIEDHNKLSDDKQDLIELMKHIVDNCLANLNDIRKFLEDLLHGDNTLMSLEDKNVSKICPYLKLQEKLQWRNAISAADQFGFVYWLAHRHRRGRGGFFGFERRIRGAIRKVYKNYGRRNQRRQNRRIFGSSPLFATFDSPRMIPLFSRAFHLNDINNSFDNIRNRINLGSLIDKSLFVGDDKITQTA